MADRLTLPRTSVGVAAALGLGTATTTIVLSHPEPAVGSLAAGLSIAGGLLFAAGLLATARRGPLGLTVGAIAVHVAAAVSLGALWYVLRPIAGWHGVRPLAAAAAVVAAGLSMIAVVYLSLVVTGHADPASLAAYDGVVVRWIAALTAIAIGVVGLAMVEATLHGNYVGNALAAHLAVVGRSWTEASAAVLAHLVVVAVLGAGFVHQLGKLGLFEAAGARRLTWRLLVAIALFGVALLVPLLLAHDPWTVDELARRSPAAADALVWLGTVPMARPFHLLVLGLDALLSLAFGASLGLRLVRATPLERAATAVGYVAGPLVAVSSLVVALSLSVDLVGVDAYALLGLRPRGSIATAAGGSPPVSVQAGVATALTWTLFFGVGVGMVGTRVLFGILYRFRSRGLPAAASAGLVGGASVLALTGTHPAIVACCIVAGILTWDLLENAVGLGEQLDGRFNAVRNELAHALASGSVGGLAVVAGLGTYEVTSLLRSGRAPSLLVLVALLAAGVVFALFLRRS